MGDGWQAREWTEPAQSHCARAEGDSLSILGQDAPPGLTSWNQHCSTAAVSGTHGHFYFSIVSRQSAGICSPFHFFVLSPEDAFHGEFQCFSYPHKQALLCLFSRENSPLESYQIPWNIVYSFFVGVEPCSRP